MRSRERHGNHMPTLNGLAKKLGRRAMEEVTLEQVLDGSSCSPISFREFQNFTVHKEYTVENLLFVIWYRSYLRRFEQLAETERNKVDIPSNKLVDGSSPFAHLQKGRKTWVERVRQQSVTRLGAASGMDADDRRKSSSIPLISIFTRSGSGQTILSPLQGASPEHKEHLDIPPTSTMSSAYLPEVRPADQPMRREAERAFETFLKQGAEKELNVTEEMRTRCRIALEGSTHPDVFLPIYKEIYGFLEMQTLPHFLSYAQTNVNLPKQLFWYGVGLTDLVISILILVLMIVLLPGRSFGWRAARLASLPFASFGAMQTYSAWRGFCTQVWGRTSRQLHPWELEAQEEQGDASTDRPNARSLDLEGGGWVDPWVGRSLKPPAVEKGSPEMNGDHVSWVPTCAGAADQGQDPVDPISAGSSSGHSEQRRSAHDGLTAGYSNGDLSDISPWNEPLSGPAKSDTNLIFPFSEGQEEQTSTSTAVQRRRSVGLQQSTMLRRLLRNNKNETTTPHQRPPVFGDEVVIVDERVIRLHKQIVRDILVVGAVWALIWIAICLAIPKQ